MDREQLHGVADGARRKREISDAKAQERRQENLEHGSNRPGASAIARSRSFGAMAMAILAEGHFHGRAVPDRYAGAWRSGCRGRRRAARYRHDFRSGTRFGPMAMRQSRAVNRGYNFEMGLDLSESLDIVDVGDVSVIPANIEKSFDQIDKAVAYIHEREVFPVILGGDHSIGYPDIRGLAPYIDGNIGIIHFDRHTDMSEFNMDERMHGTPFFHATNIENAPPVQPGPNRHRRLDQLATERQECPRTRAQPRSRLTDIDRWGWNGSPRWRSRSPGRTPRPSSSRSISTRSILPLRRAPARRKRADCCRARRSGCCISRARGAGRYGGRRGFATLRRGDVTSLLGVRVILETLGTLVLNGKLGKRPEPAPTTRQVNPFRDRPFISARPGTRRDLADQALPRNPGARFGAGFDDLHHCGPRDLSTRRISLVVAIYMAARSIRSDWSTPSS